MKLEIPSVLRTPAGDEGDPGGGIGNPLTPALRAEIGRQLNGWIKREGAQVMQEAIQQAFTEQMPTLQENFLNGLAQELPSDEEIEMQEAIEAGYDPKTDMFYTPEGQPYDPASGQLLEIDPRTGEVYYAEDPNGYDQPDPRLRLEDTDPRYNAEFYELRRQNELLQQQMTELQSRYESAETQAEKADREAQIGRLLNSVPFANDKAAAQFRAAIEDNVFRLDDGTLVAGDPNRPLPLDKFIEAEIQSSPHMVQSRPMGGSGAFSKPGMRPNAPTMDQIRPFQPKEERDALIKSAVEAFQGPTNPV